VVVLVSFLLGVAVTAFWVYAHAKSGGANQSGEGGANGSFQLSESTRAVLRRLNSPLEIRYYCLLDPAGAPDSLKAFGARADALLSEYEKEGAGKIKVARFKTDSDPNTAVKDGITGFNLDKGNGCYLGLAIKGNGQTQLLPRLSPEWEPALEWAIAKAAETVSTTTARAAAPSDAAALEAVKRSIPNLDTVSLQDGTRILRESALKEFAQVAQETEAKVKEAQQLLVQAQTNQSAADQQAAMKHLQQIQADQNEKLKQIAARAQAEIQALQQYKSAAR
jgi:hypothetical protein